MPLNQQEFFKLVLEARAGGATVFLSSHVLSEVEHVCERVGIIRHGRLVKVAEVLKDFGRRVQYSVFECDLDDKGLDELRDRLATEIDAATDSCRIYRLCDACAGEVLILGRGDRYSEPGFVVV